MIDKQAVVLVTGGTGFTGVHLVKKLAETGCELRVIARSSSNRSQLDGLNIRWFLGDVYDPEVVDAAMAGVNYVFHVAAAYREAHIGDEIYHKVHVVSTQLIAAAAVKQPDFRRLIHVSTVGVLGHVAQPPADESTAYNPGDIYQETKTEAEKWILEFAASHGLPYVVVRPAAIYGPGDRRLLKLYKMAKMPVVPLIGFTKGLYHLVHVSDLVGFMVYAADSDRALNGVFICGSAEPVSIKSIIATIAHKMHKEPRFFRVPAWPVFLLGDICEAVCKPFKIEPPIYRRRIAFFTKDRAFNTARMRDTGYQNQVTDQQGLEELYDWYQHAGWL